MCEYNKSVLVSSLGIKWVCFKGAFRWESIVWVRKLNGRRPERCKEASRCLFTTLPHVWSLCSACFEHLRKWKVMIVWILSNGSVVGKLIISQDMFEKFLVFFVCSSDGSCSRLRFTEVTNRFWGWPEVTLKNKFKKKGRQKLLKTFLLRNPLSLLMLNIWLNEIVMLQKCRVAAILLNFSSSYK